MEINQSLKSNLIADVENILSIKISDENTDLLSRCFEITIGHAIPKLSISEREAKLQERLDLQIYANDSLLAQNRGLMELNETRKESIRVYAEFTTKLLDCAKDVTLFAATTGLKGNQTAFSDNQKELVSYADKIVELRQRIREIEKELGLNKE